MSDTDSSSFSIAHSEDSLVLKVHRSMAETNARIEAAKRPLTQDSDTEEASQEMIQLQYGRNVPPTLSPLTPIDMTDASQLAMRDTHSDFMLYGDSVLQQPAVVGDLNVQATPKVQKPAAKESTGELPAAKQKRLKKYHTLDPPLSLITYEQKSRIMFGDEENTDKKGDVGPFRVAQYAITGSHETNNYRKWELDKLKSEQLRQFAMNVGCTRVGSLSKFLVRKEIALRVDLGTMYEQVNMPSVRTTSDEKKLNSLLRIINACFLPSTVDRLISLNDIKKRDDYEAAHGGNPIKDFWLEISNYVNDGEDRQLSILLYSTLEEDPYISKWMADGTDTGLQINLTDFNTQTHKTCKAHIGDLMKCRSKLLEAMKTSGSNTDDSMNYCNGTRLQPRKGVDVPKEALYYLDKHCRQHPDIDRAFTDVLAKELRSDSSDPHITTKTPTVASASKVKEEFLKAIEKTTEEAREANLKAASQREELIKLQKEEMAEARTSSVWSQYTDLSSKYFQMKEAEANAKLIRNIAKRLRDLENKIDIAIEDSVVDDDDL
jgi:hypothetical protein